MNNETNNTNQQTLWAAIRKGWVSSIILGLAALLIRYKALIPLVWQILVKNGSAHTIGKGVDDLTLFAAAIAGCALFIYAVRIGYRRINQELDNNSDYAIATGISISSGDIAFRLIGRISLFINAPLLYWAAFLFVLLPQLVKLPNASLRIGTTTALAGAFLAMAVIIVVATHVGLLLTRSSFRSITKPLVPAAVPFYAGGPYNQPYPQQNVYQQPGGYSFNAPQSVSVYNQPNTYAQQEGYYPPASQTAPSGVSVTPYDPRIMRSQPSPSYPQQGMYPPQQVGYTPSTQPVGIGNPPNNQPPFSSR